MIFQSKMCHIYNSEYQNKIQNFWTPLLWGKMVQKAKQIQLVQFRRENETSKRRFWL